MRRAGSWAGWENRWSSWHPALSELLELLEPGGDQVLHPDRGAALGREQGPAQGDVADAATGHREPPRERHEIDVGRDRRARGQVVPPELDARGLVGRGELDHEAQSPRERVVDVVAQVAREDHDALVVLAALQEVRGLDVRVPARRV